MLEVFPCMSLFLDVYLALLAEILHRLDPEAIDKTTAEWYRYRLPVNTARRFKSQRRCTFSPQTDTGTLKLLADLGICWSCSSLLLASWEHK